MYDIVHQCVSVCLILVIDEPTQYSLLNVIQATWAGLFPIIYVMFWSDKMNYDKAGRQTGHPLTISLGASHGQ